MSLSVDTIQGGAMVRAAVDVPAGVVWTLTGTAGGVEWVAAREVGRGSVHWVSDPMAPLGVAASYRLTYGSTVETAGPVTRADAGATLICSMDGRTVARVDRMASGGDLWDWQATTSLLDIPGSAPVARYGQPVARDGGAVVETTGADTRTLVELVRAGRPVIVLHDEAACQIQDCDIAPTMRVTLTGHRADRTDHVTTATRSWDLSWREARAPWRFAAPVVTYDDVRAAFPTYQDLIDSGLSWAQIAAGEWL